MRNIIAIYMAASLVGHSGTAMAADLSTGYPMTVGDWSVTRGQTLCKAAKGNDVISLKLPDNLSLYFELPNLPRPDGVVNPPMRLNVSGRPLEVRSNFEPAAQLSYDGPERGFIKALKDPNKVNLEYMSVADAKWNMISGGVRVSQLDMAVIALDNCLDGLRQPNRPASLYRNVNSIHLQSVCPVNWQGTIVGGDYRMTVNETGTVGNLIDPAPLTHLAGYDPAFMARTSVQNAIRRYVLYYPATDAKGNFVASEVVYTMKNTQCQL